LLPAGCGSLLERVSSAARFLFRNHGLMFVRIVDWQVHIHSSQFSFRFGLDIAGNRKIAPAQTAQSNVQRAIRVSSAGVNTCVNARVFARLRLTLFLLKRSLRTARECRTSHRPLYFYWSDTRRRTRNLVGTSPISELIRHWTPNRKAQTT
jgi:hypothetical protein